MKKSTLIIAILALSLAAVAAMAVAAPQEPYPRPEFSREEYAKVQPIFAEHEKAVYPLHEGIRAKRAELDTLYYSGAKDSAKVQALYRDIADMQAKLFMAKIELKAKLVEQGFTGPGMHGGPGMYGGPGRHGGPGMYDRQGWGHGPKARHGGHHGWSDGSYDRGPRHGRY